MEGREGQGWGCGLGVEVSGECQGSLGRRKVRRPDGARQPHGRLDASFTLLLVTSPPACLTAAICLSTAQRHLFIPSVGSCRHRSLHGLRGHAHYLLSISLAILFLWVFVICIFFFQCVVVTLQKPRQESHITVLRKSEWQGGDGLGRARQGKLGQGRAGWVRVGLAA